MNLQEMGERLRQERERRGFTLDEVVLKTKISRTNIEAIEAGRKDDLPHPVYAKGFVKNYARLLGLDPEEFGRALALEYTVAEDDFGTPPTVEKPMAVPARRARTKARKSRWQFLVLLLVVAAVAAGLLIYFMRAPSTLPGAVSTESEVMRPVTGDVPSLTPNEVHKAVPEAAPEAAPAPEPEAAPAAAPKPVAPKPAAQAAPAAPPVHKAEPQAPAATPAPAAPTADTAPAVQYAHHLDITATDLCWVHGLVDGSTEVDLMLQPGEHKRLRFNDSLTVKFGNAGGVDLAYDGKAVGNTAEPGQVRTFTFP